MLFSQADRAVQQTVAELIRNHFGLFLAWMSHPISLALTVVLIAFLAAPDLGGVSTLRAQEDDQPAAKNPLQQAIQKILQLNRQPVEDQNEEKTERDQIDQRAPLAREQATLLKSAQTRVERGQFADALKIYQSLLDGETESVVLGDSGNFQSIRWETHRRIAALPPQAARLYQQVYGTLAKNMLAEATEQADMELIRRVANQFFHTESGYAAANRIASFHLDRGEFAIAARWYRRLDATAAQFTSDPLWQFKVQQTLQRADFTEAELADWVELNDEQENQLVARLPADSLTSVREQWQQLAELTARPISDWLLPGGTQSRAAHPQGTPPLLISHWKQSLTDQADIREQIEQLTDDLKMSGSPTIPAMQPLLVNGRVIFRTFDGLRVVAADSGEVLWETRDRVSAEMLLRGGGLDNQPTQQLGRVRVVINGNVVSQYYGSQAEKHPITSFLYRNAVHGTLSSDGQRVFAIERNAILSNAPSGNYYSNFDPSKNDPFRRDWASNRLTAYDLETGQQLWTAGGEQMFETIDPVLAGTYFFGPPLCDSGELFVIGEQENALKLFCLSAQTGQLVWSQLLAYTDVEISKDVTRRWWPTSVALSEGVLVCPTNIGFLIGVDRQSHEIVWMTRYGSQTPKEEQKKLQLRGGRITITGAGELQDRWFPTPPMIIGQTVVYAPPEEMKLIAYRLSDGKERWTIDSLDEGLYPLGHYGDEFLVVTSSGINGYALRTGELLWEAAFSDFSKSNDSAAEQPTGRGIIVGDQAMIPINDQELWYFDLPSRQFKSRAAVSSSSAQLGNLIMANGKLVVSSPLDVNFFEPKQRIEEQIASRLQNDSRDAWALLKQAEILTLEKQYADALAALRLVDRDALAQAEQESWRTQMLTVLIGYLQDGPTEHDAEFALLGELIATPDEQQQYLRLLADRMLARKDLAAAFEAYAKLAQFDQNSTVQDQQDRQLTVRQDVWLNSRLKQLWRISSGNVSAQIAESVQQAISEAIDSGDLATMQNVVRIYGFHPEIEPLYLEMIDVAVEQRNFGVADFALNNMASLDDPSIQATALTRRADLLRRFGLNDDASHLTDQINQFDADLVLLDGLTVEEWREEFSAEMRDNIAEQHTDSERPAAASGWADETYEVVPIGTSSWSYQRSTINLEATDLPYYRQHRFFFDQKGSRLEITRSDSDELVWSIPLQQIEKVGQSSVLPVRFHGHLMLTFYRGMVQCYSLPDQKMLWSRAVSQQPGVANRMQASKQRLQEMREAKDAASRFRINQSSSEFGPLAALTAQTFCYTGRNELIGADPLTGEIRWVRRGFVRGTRVYGDAEVLCVVPPNVADAYLISALDGARIEHPKLANIVEQGIAVVGHQIITVEDNSATRILGLQKGQYQLVGKDLLTQENSWEYRVDRDDHLGLLDAETLVIVDERGGVELLDLNSGELMLNSQLDPKVIRGQKQLFAFRDHQRLYLVANHSTSHSTYMSIFNQRVNGYIAAVDLENGDELWVHKTPALNLVLDDMQQMPVFILGGSKHQRKHNLYIGQFKVQVIDKQTGKVLLDDMFTTQNQVQQISWSQARKQIRMHAYNAIYTLQPERKLAVQPDE